MTQKATERRYPIGAELTGDGRVHFRIWAPKAEKLEVATEGQWLDPSGAETPPTFHELDREDGGYFSGAIEAEAGTLYRFRLKA